MIVRAAQTGPMRAVRMPVTMGPAAIAPIALLVLCPLAIAVWAVSLVPGLGGVDQAKLGGSLALLTEASLLPVTWFWINDRAQIVNPVAAQGASFFFFGVLGTIFALRNTSLLTGGETSLRHLPYATCLMTLGFLSFCTGYALVGMGKRPHIVVSRDGVKLQQWDSRRVAFAFTVLVGAAWTSRAYAASLGFVATKFMSESLTGNPFIIALYQRSHALIALAAALAFLFAAQQATSRNGGRLWQLIAVALLVLETVYFGLIQFTRMQTVYGWAAAFFVLCLIGRTPWRSALIVTLLFVGLFLPLVLRARQLAAEQGAATGASGFELVSIATSMLPAAFEDVTGSYLTSFDDSLGHSTHFANADVLTAFIDEQDEKGLPPMGLEPLMQSAIQLVPRVIWPSKPEPYDKTRAIKAYYGYWDDDDIQVSPVGELYACFGLFGIGIGMMLNGALLKLLFQRLLSGPPTILNSGTALYAAFGFELGFLQTDLVATLAPMRDLLLLWLFLSWVFRTQNARGRVGSIHMDAVNPITRLSDAGRRPA